MAIVAIDPADWENVNVVQIDSDAHDNKEAIIDIENWAGEHGFARTNEYWLRQILKNRGRRVFRGICYRLTEEVVRSNEAACQSSAEALSKMPPTPHQVDEDR